MLGTCLYLQDVAHDLSFLLRAVVPQLGQLVLQQGNLPLENLDLLLQAFLGTETGEGAGQKAGQPGAITKLGTPSVPTASSSLLAARAAPEPHLLLQGSPQLGLQLRLLFLGLRQGGVVLLGQLVQGVLQLHQVAGDLPQLQGEAGQAAVTLSSPCGVEAAPGPSQIPWGLTGLRQPPCTPGTERGQRPSEDEAKMLPVPGEPWEARRTQPEFLRLMLPLV